MKFIVTLFNLETFRMCKEVFTALKVHLHWLSFLAKTFMIQHRDYATLHVLPTLGNMTPMCTFLFVSHCPRQPRHIGRHNHDTESWMFLPKNFIVVNTALLVSGKGETKEMC